ncbi:MAG: hypothetical protein JWQ95_2293, partial [Sphaerisporangium sp.]|nr:hypothetical protein [Sphaerisporangium sp.]
MTLHAEWIKFWSVRSTAITLAVAALFAFGLCLADTMSTVRS